jgi:hypothetical protein
VGEESGIMGDARRLEWTAAGFVDRSDAIRQFVDAVLRDADPTVAVGPAVWDVTAGHDVRRWYFMVGSCD